MPTPLATAPLVTSTGRWPDLAMAANWAATWSRNGRARRPLRSPRELLAIFTTTTWARSDTVVILARGPAVRRSGIRRRRVGDGVVVARRRVIAGGQVVGDRAARDRLWVLGGGPGGA